jgi:hypothetical protein
MAIVSFKIRRTKIVLVGKYRFSKKSKNDLLSRFTYWIDWRIALWFRRNKIVGAKDFKNPKNWESNLVNDYMLGFDFLIFKGWINWNTGGMALKIDNLETNKKEKEDSFIFEKVATSLIKENKVNAKMSEEDMTLEIYGETSKLVGEKRANHLLRVDEDYLNDTISEIKERLKNETASW